MSSLPASMKKIRSKNEGARVDTMLYSNFSDAQGQITLVLMSVSGRNLNHPSFHACPRYLQE